MNVFVARQPIFESGEKVHGYELLYRHASSAQSAMITGNGNHASARVIVDTFLSMDVQTLTSGKRAFINFTEELFDADIVGLLPPSLVVVEILENVLPGQKVIDTCKELKKHGYKLALDDFEYREELQPLLALVDILKIDFTRTPLPEQYELIQRVQNRNLQLLAEKVETREDFSAALELGYGYFQGYFFSKPTLVAGTAIPSFKASCLQLLQDLYRPDFEFSVAEKHFKNDLALSHKLLRLVNSAGVGLVEQVDSIKHALVLLGQESIRRWFTLIALAEMGSDKPAEIIAGSIVRAQFWESLAAAAGLSHMRHQAFLMGMFSMIDAILDRPLPETLQELPLAAEIKEALLGEENDLRAVLEIGLAYETANWDSLKKDSARLGLAEAELPEMYQSAIRWVSGAIDALAA